MLHVKEWNSELEKKNMSVKISALLCFIYVSLFCIILFSFISRPKNEVKKTQEIKFAPDIKKDITSKKHDFKSRKIVHKHDHKGKFWAVHDIALPNLIFEISRNFDQSENTILNTKFDWFIDLKQ